MSIHTFCVPAVHTAPRSHSAGPESLPKQRFLAINNVYLFIYFRFIVRAHCEKKIHCTAAQYDGGKREKSFSFFFFFLVSFWFARTTYFFGGFFFCFRSVSPDRYIIYNIIAVNTTRPFDPRPRRAYYNYLLLLLLPYSFYGFFFRSTSIYDRIIIKRMRVRVKLLRGKCQAAR